VHITSSFFGINVQIHFVNLTTLVSVHLIHLSSHHHSQHPLLLHSFTSGSKPTFLTNPSHLGRLFLHRIMTCCVHWFIKPPLARAAYCIAAVHLFVCRQNTKKTRFSQKLSSLELWSLLTTYRKSYMRFSKNHYWTHKIQDG